MALGVLLIFVGAKLVEGYGRATSNERDMREVAHIFKLIAYPVLVIILLHTFNISIGSLLVGAGFLGIIVGLAAQTSLGNAFAGISILYSRPFQAGDKITFTPTSFGMQAPSYPHETMLTEITGTVKSIGIIYTRLLRDDLSLMYIPNSALNQGLIQNQSRVSEKMVRIRLDVPMNTNVESFKKRLNTILSANKAEHEKLRALEVKISLISNHSDIGIIVTARVKVLDYDRLSQWLSESSIKALLNRKR